MRAVRTKEVTHLGLAAPDAVLQVVIELGRPVDDVAGAGRHAHLKVLERRIVGASVQVLALQDDACDRAVPGGGGETC